MNAPDHKRCLGCGYILDGLPEPRCPECGRRFDPSDTETVAKAPFDALVSLWFVLGGIVAFGLALVVDPVFLYFGIGAPATGGAAEPVMLLLAVVGLGCEILGLVIGIWVFRQPPALVTHRSAAIVACLLVTLLFSGCCLVPLRIGHPGSNRTPTSVPTSAQG